MAAFAVAKDVHAIHMAAYALEASVLDVRAGEFPPQLRSAKYLQFYAPVYIGGFLW